MCKECKECKVPVNGDKMHYDSFEELTDDLKELYCGLTSGRNYTRAKKGYVYFINKLNENGDKLLSDYIDNSTKVRIRYGKCGHEHPEGKGARPNDYKNGHGCGICSGDIVVEGENDLATKCPEIAKEWHPTKNGDLKPTKVTCGSNRRVWWLCPDCGHEWEAVINDRTGGYGCPNCGDGISRPEKVLALLLDSLNIKFEKQLKFDGHKFLYDFYLIDYGIIIEVHGGQHYNIIRRHPSWKSYEEEHENDLFKYDIAVLNGYEYNKNYFIIDARESNIEWLRNSINNCLFFQRFDLNNINWKEIDIQAQKSKKIEVCRYWKEQKEINKDLTIATIVETFNVSRRTTTDWLTWGNKSGLCIYNSTEERKTENKRKSNFVYLIKPNGTKEYDEPMSQRGLSKLTGISSHTIKDRLKDGKPIIANNSKYIGCYIVDAEEWDAQYN